MHADPSGLLVRFAAGSPELLDEPVTDVDDARDTDDCSHNDHGSFWLPQGCAPVRIDGDSWDNEGGQ